MNVQYISKQGKRPQNEDKHSIITNLSGEDRKINNINLYAVYDGHGGKYVSEYLSKKLPPAFLDRSLEYPLNGRTINSIYKTLTADLQQNHLKQSSHCGSTCLVVLEYRYKTNRYIDILNTGDSRCVLCIDNMAIAKTKDHKPNWPEEKERITKLGGDIYFDGYDWRIKDLSVSRAFGDNDATPYLTSKPEVFRHRITQNEKFMILACDGLWDVIDNQTAVNLVLSECYTIRTGCRNTNKINIARRLADYALEKGSTDNITVVVVFLN